MAAYGRVPGFFRPCRLRKFPRALQNCKESAEFGGLPRAWLEHGFMGMHVTPAELASDTRARRLLPRKATLPPGA